MSSIFYHEIGRWKSAHKVSTWDEAAKMLEISKQTLRNWKNNSAHAQSGTISKVREKMAEWDQADPENAPKKIRDELAEMIAQKRPDQISDEECRILREEIGFECTIPEHQKALESEDEPIEPPSGKEDMTSITRFEKAVVIQSIMNNADIDKPSKERLIRILFPKL